VQPPIVYNLAMLAVDAAAIGLIAWRPGRLTWVASWLLFLACGGGLAWGVAFGMGWSGFGFLQLLAWMTFVHGLIFSLGAARAARGRAPGLYGASNVFALGIAAVGVDAFFVEPTWLEVSRVEIADPRIQRPLRIAVLADIQTDWADRHEAAALAAAVAESPDLVLLPGDYLHVYDQAEFDAAAAEFTGVINGARMRPRLGAFAVGGDVDVWGWPKLFEGTAVQALEETQTLDLGEILLTGLTPKQSRRRASIPEAPDRFHVVFGHAPDFALAKPPADLLIAGHTHGGQVQLPFFGPIMTLTAVPRAWASGHTALPWGGHLVVSRGVGLERKDAPRMRFLCRPEVVIIDLVPRK